ncbi:uncharacterized protein LOC106182026 [Lingula anatina]|uniref:Uncharacterized protein LOC106182026 n=1 Tax=Lingula anatina TaxID=7574 RepID=A0A1S3KHJ8_LINAN|nr:uncharacterized protein LOC106182026 [Lingula anatina]|eukprot:XP_013422103.1 uncharacterized protein LOC106182026 [Lingula anatina]
MAMFRNGLSKVIKFVNNVSRETYIVAILTVFSCGTLSTYYAWTRKTRRHYAMFSDQNYYKDAVEILKGYTPAISYLGEPVTAKPLSPFDPASVVGNELSVVIKIPVLGPKGKGHLFSFASREKENTKFEIYRLDFEQYTKEYTKRWTFYINKNKLTEEMETKQTVLDKVEVKEE